MEASPALDRWLGAAAKEKRHTAHSCVTLGLLNFTELVSSSTIKTGFKNPTYLSEESMR